MKIIHCADIHLGVERGPLDKSGIPGRVLDFLESLDSMIDFAIEENVDLILIAGDIFHTNNPNQMLTNLFAKRLHTMAEHCPVVVLVGNHDTPGPLHRKTSIDVFSVIEMSNVYIGNKFETLIIRTKSGDIQVTTFPYPTRHLVTPSSYKELINKEEYPERILEIFDELRCTIKTGIPAIFLGHFTVTGSRYGSERPLIVGNEAEVDLLAVLTHENEPETVWDYYALGHLHYHQEVFGDPPVVYSGSLDRVDFGEENDDKGFVLIDINDEQEVAWEFISVDPRPMVTLRIDLTGKKRVAKIIEKAIMNANLEGAIVRVVIDVDNSALVASEDVLRLLEEARVYWVHSVNINVPREITMRLELDKPVNAYSKTELLGIYFGTQDIDDPKILELADSIMREVD